jgi:tetratricopeptide (TPR) repeat protein
MLSAVLVSVALVFAPVLAAPPTFQQRSTIEGMVTADNRPVVNARVYLKDDGYAQVNQGYTDGSGRFRFASVLSGVYYVEIDPIGTEYERQTQRVEAVPFSGRSRSAGEIFRINFDLIPKKKRGADAAKAGAGERGVAFYQDVPQAARQQFERGRKSLEKGDFEEAAAALKGAVASFPDYYDALELLGTEYVKRQQYQPAVPLLRRAVEVNKNGWRGFYSLGIALAESDQTAEALGLLRRAVELNPRSPNTNMRLGMLLAQAEPTRAEAVQTFRKVVELDDKHIPDAYLYLARLQDLSGQLRPAIEAMKSYVGIAPQDDPHLPQALLYLAQMYERDGRFAEAADAVEASLRAAPHTDQKEKLTMLAQKLRQRAATTPPKSN